MPGSPYEIIGSKRESGFRVPGDYFALKERMSPAQDPTTGGALIVVYAGTDRPVVGASIVQSGPYRGQITGASLTAGMVRAAAEGRQYNPDDDETPTPGGNE
jgi:hypothetical protein